MTGVMTPVTYHMTTGFSILGKDGPVRGVGGIKYEPDKAYPEEDRETTLAQDPSTANPHG